MFPKIYTLADQSTVIIRKIEFSDAMEIIPLLNNIFTTAKFVLTTPEEFNPTLEQQLTRIQDFMVNTVGRICLVAEYKGKLVAHFDIANSPKKRAQHVGEAGIGIHSDYRHLGIGKILLGAAIEWAKTDAILEKMYIEIFPENTDSLRLAARYNFVEEGRKIKAIKLGENNYKDLICLGLWLK